MNHGQWDEFGGFPIDEQKPFSWLRTLSGWALFVAAVIVVWRRMK